MIRELRNKSAIQLLFAAFYLGAFVAPAYAQAPQLTESEKINVPLQLDFSEELREKISEAIKRTFLIDAPTLTLDELKKASGFAPIIVGTSSVEKSEDGRFVILYTTLADLFTIITYSPTGSIGRVQLINGSQLNTAMSKGNIVDDKDFTIKAFKQRPNLQRSMTSILMLKSKEVEETLAAIQSNKENARLVLIGLAMQLGQLNEYKNSPCKPSIEAYRNSETFALRFVRGKSDALHMMPLAVTEIAGASNVIMQDDVVGRIFTFLELSPGATCQVKKIRTFVSY